MTAFSMNPDMTYEVRPIPGTIGPSMKSIRKSIDAALSSLSSGETVAVVAHADLKGGRAAIVARLPGGFSFMGWADKSWKGPASAGAQIMWKR